jgi:hypothetical protein
MNNKQLYLAWLRTAAPSVYTAALRKATGQVRSFGGLTDDLVQQSFAPSLNHSFLGDDTSSVDLSNIDFSNISNIDVGQIDTGAIDAQITSGTAANLPSVTATTTSAPSTFSNILTAVTAIGAGVINATNQSKLITLNTQRAAQGLPPVDATGRVVSGTGFSTTSPSLLAFERAISGGSTGSFLPILAVLGIGAFFLLRRPSTAA